MRVPKGSRSVCGVPNQMCRGHATDVSALHQEIEENLISLVDRRFLEQGLKRDYNPFPVSHPGSSTKI